MPPDLKKEYETLWQSCTVNSNNSAYVTWAANLCIKNKDRYSQVANQVGCPWYLVAILHCLESSFDFNTHLYNGDPLSARTVQYPPGRPKEGNPPFSWEYSALCALRDDGAGNIKTWDIASVLYFCESYNGMGYRNGSGQKTTPPRRSPYLWAMTNHYQRGKYVADGKFDPNAVSAQVGAAAILKTLEARGQINPTIVSQSTGVTREVTWFNIYLIKNESGIFEIGLAAKLENSDDTYATTRIRIPYDQINLFISKFPRAKTIIQAEPNKKWPGDLPLKS
jgi:lysozyme family protein